MLKGYVCSDWAGVQPEDGEIIRSSYISFRKESLVVEHGWTVHYHGFIDVLPVVSDIPIGYYFDDKGLHYDIDADNVVWQIASKAHEINYVSVGFSLEDI